jgi:hypothetical protein
LQVLSLPSRSRSIAFRIIDLIDVLNGEGSI